MYAFVTSGVNLFVGDAGPDNSKHLILKNLKIPDLEEMTASHHAGGSLFGVDVGGLGMKPLSPTFKVLGPDPQTMSQFGVGGRTAFPFTAYGHLQNKADGSVSRFKAIWKGRLTRANPGDFSRGTLLDFDHEIKEVLHYEFFLGTQEKFYFDWPSQQWRVDGVPQNQDELTSLAIPT